MKSFKFRLANYLKIKEFEEKNSWTEVLRQEALLTAIKNKIELLMGIMEDSRRERDRLGQDPKVNQNTAEMINESLGGLQQRLKDLFSDYQLQKSFLEKAQEIHNEKKKEAKVLEKFEERKKRDFKITKDKTEQKLNNEIAGNLFVRRDKKHG